MNVELEKKYRIQDSSVVMREINALGAQFKSETRDVDVYFVVPQENPCTRYLRVRIGRDKSILAYHEVANDLETKEWETGVANADTAKEILGKLGFSVDVVVDKTRKRYQLAESEILLDYVKGLGYFIEIESPTEQALDAIADKITLGEQITGKGYPDLLKKNNCAGR